MAETMKEANRRAVRHAHNKLIDLGLHWRGMGEATLPHIEPDVAERLLAVEKDLDSVAVLDGTAGFDPNPDQMLIAKLAETEHRRWLVDRALDGWRPGARNNRDNGRRIHCNMVAFRELDKPNQAYDTVLVRALLDHFSFAHRSPAQARFARRQYLVLDDDRQFGDAEILAATTEVLLAWPGHKQFFSAQELEGLVGALNAWAGSEAATRLRIVLGRPVTAQDPKADARLSGQDFLRELAARLDPEIDVAVIRLYGAARADASPALPDEQVMAYLKAAVP